MKSLVLAAAAVAAISSSAFAGGPTVVADDPMPDAMAAPAAAHDWSGFYAGLSYGRASSSEIVDTTASVVYSLSKGSNAGLHFGYLVQRNQLVFGGELSVLNYNDVIMAGLPTYHFDRTLDLKGRLGLASNRALFYGSLGYSTGVFAVDLISDSYKPKGVSYGIGVDFAATDRLTIGLEYLARRMQADRPIALANDIEVNLNTLSLRVGLSF